MSERDSFKEYLVKIGFSLDELGYNKANSLIEALGLKLSKNGTVTKNWAKAFSFVTNAIYSLDKSFVSFLDKVTKADNEVEKLSRSLWIAEDRARAFSTASDIFGISSADDLYQMSDANYRRFLDIYNLSSTLGAPSGADEFLETVKDINNELNKTKVIFQSSTRWIAYYLNELLGGEFSDLEDFIARINKWLIEKLPVISKKIAEFFSIIYTAGKRTVEFFINSGEKIKNWFDDLPDVAKSGLAGVSAAIAFFLSGPAGRAVILISGLILLIDDFLSYQKGLSSFFDWSGPSGDFMETMGTGLGGLVDLLEGVLTFIGRINEGFLNMFDTIKLANGAEVNSALYTLTGWAITFLGAIEASVDLFNLILGTQGMTWEKFNERSATRYLRSKGLYDLAYGQNPITSQLFDPNKNYYYNFDTGMIEDNAGSWLEQFALSKEDVLAGLLTPEEALRSILGDPSSHLPGVMGISVADLSKTNVTVKINQSANKDGSINNDITYDIIKNFEYSPIGQ